MEKLTNDGIAGRIVQSPLRVDFAGGWLDCPSYARANAYIVNCAIAPLVTLEQLTNCDRIGTGLGVSAARSLLLGKDPVAEELGRGVGWQDPAVIARTGLCVWRSGPLPVLDSRFLPAWLDLEGTMALLWTGARDMCSTGIGQKPRNLDVIQAAGLIARAATVERSRKLLYNAVDVSYQAQRMEGMAPLPEYGESAKKYCGAGFGGMALYLFADRPSRNRFLAAAAEAQAIEPYYVGDGL